MAERQTIRRDNPRHQGDIGVGVAIGYFLTSGYRVAAPLGESQPWDLVIEHPERGVPERVQVKTTTCRSPYGIFVVTLATRGGNQSWAGLVRRFDPGAVEWLFVYADDGSAYMIPSSEISATTALSLGERMEPYRIPQRQLCLPL